MNPGGFFLYIEGGDLCAETENNAVSRRVTRDFRAKYARKHLAEYGP